jgi:hypothetical protein
VKTFRLGRIKAAVWENEADQKKYFNVTFARTYVDEAKAYHDTDSFGRDDLPLVAKLADQAHVHLRTARGTEIRTERITLASTGGRYPRPPFLCSSSSFPLRLVQLPAPAIFRGAKCARRRQPRSPIQRQLTITR